MSRTCTREQWFRARQHDPAIQAALDRQRKVAEMREAGLTFPQIARELGVCTGRARILYAKSLKHRDGSRVAA